MSSVVRAKAWKTLALLAVVPLIAGADCDTTPVPPNFGIEVVPANLAVPGDAVRVIVDGHGFTPGGSVHIGLTGVPTVPEPGGAIDRGDHAIDSQGRFNLQVPVTVCANLDAATKTGEFLVIARDAASGHFDTVAVSNSILACG